MSVGPGSSDQRGLSPISRRAFLGRAVKFGALGASIPLLGTAGRALQPTDQADGRETAKIKDGVPGRASRKVADTDGAEKDGEACGYCNGPGRDYSHCDGDYCDYINYSDGSYADNCGYCDGPGRDYTHCDGDYCDYGDYSDSGYSDYSDSGYAAYTEGPCGSWPSFL